MHNRIALALAASAAVLWAAGAQAAALDAAVPHPAVARIVAPEREAISYGSGTLIAVQDDYGLVLTNWHVVRDGNGVVDVVFPGGFRSAGRVLKVDRDWDLALLAIWRPPVEPVRLAARAPRPGEPLSIAGYGSGSYRAAGGRCTQYLSPGRGLPFDMVELSTAARQGDSGGPILNERGELAGVLFGATWRTTAGTHAGRVARFLEGAKLTPVGPRDSLIAAAPPDECESAEEAVAMGGALPPQRTFERRASAATTSRDEADEVLAAAEELPQAVRLPTTDEGDASRPVNTTWATADYVDTAELAIAQVESPATDAVADSPRWTARLPLVEPAEPDATTASIGTLAGAADAIGDETNANDAALATPSLNWRDLAGDTALEQLKAVLAAVGLLVVSVKLLGRLIRSSPRPARSAPRKRA
jgi:hypothetical protein